MRKTGSWQWIVVMLVLVASMTGCSSASQGMTVGDVWVRAVSGAGRQGNEAGGGHRGMATPPAAGGMMMDGMNSAAYMVLRNGTREADRLLRVESDIAQAVELHQTQVENEVMTMRPVEAIEIPAGGEAVLKPGGLHVMLIGLKQPLAVGQKVSLRLVFENAAPQVVEAEVRAP